MIFGICLIIIKAHRIPITEVNKISIDSDEWIKNERMKAEIAAVIDESEMYLFHINTKIKTE